MLTNFFKLNIPFTTYKTESELLRAFENSDHLRDVLYEPDTLAPARPRNRFQNKSFHNVSFAKTKISGVEFTNCTFKDCLFIGARFEECEFHGCSFEGCNPYKVTFEKTYIDPKCLEKMLKPREHSNIGVNLFQQLMRNSVDMHQPDFAITSEFNFRKWQRHQLLHKIRTKQVSRWSYPVKWLPDFLFYLFAGYGLRAKFFLAWTIALLILLVGFNSVFWNRFVMMGSDGPVKDSSLVEVLYFSIVTITTLGFGDLMPRSNFGMLAVSAQALLGITWMAILATIIVKKIIVRK